MTWRKGGTGHPMRSECSWKVSQSCNPEIKWDKIGRDTRSTISGQRLVAVRSKADSAHLARRESRNCHAARVITGRPHSASVSAALFFWRQAHHLRVSVPRRQYVTEAPGVPSSSSCRFVVPCGSPQLLPPSSPPFDSYGITI